MPTLTSHIPSKYPRATAGPDSGLKLLIVGAGIGGLGLAIESRIQGHQVELFDSVKKWAELGDSIGLFANSSRLVYRWGIDADLAQHCGNASGFETRRYDDGKVLLTQFPPPNWEPDPLSPLYDTTRSGLHDVLVKMAEELGAKIHMGERITQYDEWETGAAVITKDGKRYEADIIACADGFKSAAKKAVLGYEDLPRHSGYAIYRAFFPADIIKNNPKTAHLINDDGKDSRHLWIGPDVHFICSSLMNCTKFNWVCTHKDEAGIEESWSLPGKVEDAMKVVDGWDEVVQEIVKSTPADRLVDWKLVYRDAYPNWSSKKGHICLVGDAAHPFIPTSQQGASQALEDAVTLALCLKKAKEQGHSMKVATQTYQDLRYDRVKAAQKLGVDNREMWHKTDLHAPDFDPESIRLRHDAWLMDHDAAKHTHENYDEVAAKLIAVGY